MHPSPLPSAGGQFGNVVSLVTSLVSMITGLLSGRPCPVQKTSALFSCFNIYIQDSGLNLSLMFSPCVNKEMLSFFISLYIYCLSWAALHYGLRLRCAFCFWTLVQRLTANVLMEWQQNKIKKSELFHLCRLLFFTVIWEDCRS